MFVLLVVMETKRQVTEQAWEGKNGQKDPRLPLAQLEMNVKQEGQIWAPRIAGRDGARSPKCKRDEEVNGGESDWRPQELAPRNWFPGTQDGEQAFLSAVGTSSVNTVCFLLS